MSLKFEEAEHIADPAGISKAIVPILKIEPVAKMIMICSAAR